MNGKEILFNEFFDQLKKLEINFCILHGYESFPANISSDIDIIIEKKAIPDLFSVINKICKVTGSEIVQLLNHEHQAYYYIIHKVINAEHVLLPLDFSGSFRRDGMIFFNAEFFLSDKSELKNFYVPQNWKTFIYYLIKKIGKLHLTNEQLEILQSHLSKNENEATDIVMKMFGEVHGLELIRYIKNNDIVSINSHLGLFKKTILQQQSILNKLDYAAFNILRIGKRIIKPTGLEIAFLGPDGSGKSSLINLLKNRELPFRKIKIFHLLVALFDNTENSAINSSPHSKRPHAILISYAKIFYFFSKYIGSFIRVVYLKIRSNLIVYDRYYDDIIVDPLRFRYKGSVSFARFLKKFLPEPDIYFLLGGSAKVLYERKKEVPIEEVSRQLAEYLKLKSKDNFILINTEKDFNSLIFEIENHIYNQLAFRIQKRYAG